MFYCCKHSPLYRVFSVIYIYTVYTILNVLKNDIFCIYLQVRIYVMTTLTQQSLQIDEGWYDAQDGSKVIELDGPIFMTKEKQISDTSYVNPNLSHFIGASHIPPN